MRLGTYLSSLTKPELVELEEQLNLTDDEKIIFYAISKGKSREELSYLLVLSTRAIDRRIKCIKNKILKIDNAI